MNEQKEVKRALPELLLTLHEVFRELTEKYPQLSDPHVFSQVVHKIVPIVYDITTYNKNRIPFFLEDPAKVIFEALVEFARWERQALRELEQERQSTEAQENSQESTQEPQEQEGS